MTGAVRRSRWIDAALAAALALGAFAATYRASGWTRAQTWFAARDVWFDADSDRVFFVEALGAWGYDRTLLHPLQPFVAAPPVYVLKELGMERGRAVRVVHAFIAALWLGAFFLLLRRWGAPPADATAFALVAGTSAAAVFWLPAIETWSLGSLSMFPALALAAGARSRAGAHVASLVASAGITLSNAMAGFFSAVARLPVKKWALASAAAAAILAGAALAHRTAFPGSAVMLRNPGGDAAWIFAAEAGGPVAIARAFFVHGLVAPEIRFLPNWRHPVWPLMTFQPSRWLSTGALSWIATPLWLALLGFGAWTLARRREAGPERSVLALTVAYQFLLHLVYGRETFLYALHYVPLLVLTASFAARTRWRWLVVAGALALAATNAVNNKRQFDWAWNYTTRAAGLKKVEAETARRFPGRALSADPATDYRFWREMK